MWRLCEHLDITRECVIIILVMKTKRKKKP